MLLKFTTILRNFPKILTKFDEFLKKIWISSGAKVRKSCRPRKTLQNEYLVAKIGVDRAENGPLKAARAACRAPGPPRPSASAATSGAASGSADELQTVRSPLYQRRFLQPNTHFAALFEIYAIFTLSHRSNPEIFSKIRPKFPEIFAKFFKFTNYWWNLRNFGRHFAKFLQNFDGIC